MVIVIYTLVLYDIENNKIRNKISNICKDYGLERIQKSVFSGIMSKNLRESMTIELKTRLGKEVGDIRIMLVEEGAYEKTIKVINL